MDVQNALKILSDVLGFDCSSFEEVVYNGTLRSFSGSLDDTNLNQNLNQSLQNAVAMNLLHNLLPLYKNV